MRLGRERGAVLIQVTLMLVVLLGCAGFAIDSGVMWVARAQAQNVADAAALSAATTFGFDTISFPSAQVVARTGAQTLVAGTQIWGAPAVVDIVACEGVSPECPQVPGFPGPTVRQYFAARATVTQAVPTYFTKLLGVPAQTVRASATGTVVPANTANCVWPLAMPDLWNENIGDTKYAQYAYPAGPPAIVAIPDEYLPPTFDGDFSATGYQLLNTTLSPSTDQFAATALVVPPPALPSLANPWPEIETGQFVAVQVPGAGGFAADLTACSGSPVRIGDALSPDTGAGTTFGAVQAAANTLIGRDPGAGWNGTKRRVSGSCASQVPTCAPISPRIVAIPMFDPEIYDRTRGGVPEIRIVNFVGFFIESVDGTEVRGHLTTLPGIADATPPNIAYQWSLMRTAVLTR